MLPPCYDLTTYIKYHLVWHSAKGAKVGRRVCRSPHRRSQVFVHLFVDLHSKRLAINHQPVSFKMMCQSGHVPMMMLCIPNGLVIANQMTWIQSFRECLERYCSVLVPIPTDCLRCSAVKTCWFNSEASSSTHAAKAISFIIHIFQSPVAHNCHKCYLVLSLLRFRIRPTRI